ncbi:abscisic acid 8'-hydroxylase 4-like [Silene latifolia]|uniref:abscisic acid 8'-hydroxylase 4-like n=1 Tax=Silene latifolia TaxID=37657 RepID=UPI003D7887BF
MFFYVSTLIIGIVLIVFGYVLVKKFHQWRLLRQYGVKLPPGSLGWPYIGETPQLFSQNPHDFFITREKRYGDVFKTHILGCPCITLASPEAVKFVLMTKASLFKPTYPKTKEKLIGKSAIFFQQGGYHAQIRKLVQASLSPDAIKPLVSDIEAIAKSTLDSWAHGRQIHTFHELKKFTFDVAVLTIFGELEDYYKNVLKENYVTLDKGYNSFPTVIPGTRYFNSVMARRKLGQNIREIINEKREKRLATKDLLGYLLNFKDEDGKTLTEDEIIDNVIGVLFAAQDTTASILTWIFKYITDDDTLLGQIQREQKAIYEANENGSWPLTWAQTKQMHVTHRVILESLRMASIISFTYREAVEDVVYNGYLIPKGWKVLPLFRNIHHNSAFFDHPQIFDASRFEAGKKPHVYMPFGYGSHACPGNEVAKLMILIFIHHLVTQFRWEVVGSKEGVQYMPFPVPEKGLPAKFWRILLNYS